MMNEGCLSGCYWGGSSVCSVCGDRLRCVCGAYVREDNLDKHIDNSCRLTEASDSQRAKQEVGRTTDLSSSKPEAAKELE